MKRCRPLLADPEIARCITTDGSTPERCLASAKHRIGWHNAAWDDKGYGVRRRARGRYASRLAGLHGRH